MVQSYVREQRAKAGGEVMFSVSDIKEDVYPAVYRRGKELYETVLWRI